MFENNYPNDRATLIERLKAKGLPAFEFNSCSGMIHVVVPLLRLSEDGLEINAQDTEVRTQLELALQYNPYHPYLFIATNSLRTSCAIGLMGEDAFGEVISTYDWEFIPDLEQAVGIFEGMWKNRDGWIKLWMEGKLNGPAAERVEASYKNLIALLNKHGYYPKSREQAKRIAKKLLDRGWEE